MKVGSDAVPAIREMLLRADWSTTGRKGIMGYLTCLGLALHDIDADASRDLAHEIISRGCHPLYKARLESITSFTISDFMRVESNQVHLFISKSLGDPDQIGALVDRWLGYVPRLDLKGISRLYVVKMEQDKYWGYYLQVLAKVVLVWRGGTAASRRDTLATEFTLYHEIGHHRDEPTGVNSKDREITADRYALNIFSLAHPYLGQKALTWITIPAIMGRSTARRKDP